MKKLVSVIGVFVILLLAFLSIEYVQRRQPSFIAINNAISWAASLIGKTTFPLVEEGGSSPSLWECGLFVSNSYGKVCAAMDAYEIWTNLVDQHPGDWNAPRGSLVFFNQNTGNHGLGHVALCTGNGNIVEAGDYLIKTSTISDENFTAPYLGWAWPPSSWPGRSGSSATAAFMIHMDNSVKENIRSTLLKLHF